MRLLSVFAALTCCVGYVCAATPPNIVYILSDDTGWANFEFINSDMHMPVTTALAKQGMNLTRHYAFQFCSPTRAALMSGRLPIHVNQLNNAEWPWNKSAVDPSMTMISAKLKQLGYSTFHAGKWHLGLSKPEYTPTGRGFDYGIGYLAGSESHLDQTRSCAACDKDAKHGVDLYANGPAFGKNGTWGAEIYTGAAVDFIDKQSPSRPFFMFVALQNTHSPIQVPDRYTNLYPESWVQGRREYCGMASAVDESVGNITEALRRNKLWDTTLVIVGSDNGGPALVNGSSFANNWPLRGSKGNDFEGGVRVASFVTGGLVPSHRYGAQITGNIHMADWWMTFCKLAGGDASVCTDNAAGVPPLDSLDMWPYLSGEVATSPRVEVPLHIEVDKGELLNGAIIGEDGHMKYITGFQSGSGWHWGPQYPNSTTKVKPTNPGCPNGCLFNVSSDPGEYHDLSASLPDVKARLKARLMELHKGSFQSDAGGGNDGPGCSAAMKDGFFVPWL